VDESRLATVYLTGRPLQGRIGLGFDGIKRAAVGQAILFNEGGER
jgi:hypothetical protein